MLITKKSLRTHPRLHGFCLPLTALSEPKGFQAKYVEGVSGWTCGCRMGRCLCPQRVAMRHWLLHHCQKRQPGPSPLAPPAIKQSTPEKALWQSRMPGSLCVCSFAIDAELANPRDTFTSVRQANHDTGRLEALRAEERHDSDMTRHGMRTRAYPLVKQHVTLWGTSAWSAKKAPSRQNRLPAAGRLASAPPQLQSSLQL